MSGIIGKKVGMTRMFDEDGKAVPCTVIVAGPCYVTQIKNPETDGYRAIQLGYGEVKDKRLTKAMAGHFAKAGVEPVKHVKEFRKFRDEFHGSLKVGQEIKVGEVFEEGDFVDAIGTSKGKGFQGVVKRHGFGGVGQSTHGQHNRQRHPGSIGQSSYPARVFPGLRMAGRMGGERVKVTNLRVYKIVPEENVIVISGSVPGPINGLIYLEK